MVRCLLLKSKDEKPSIWHRRLVLRVHARENGRSRGEEVMSQMPSQKGFKSAGLPNSDTHNHEKPRCSSGPPKTTTQGSGEEEGGSSRRAASGGDKKARHHRDC